MGSITLTNLGKVYPGGVRAVSGLDLDIADGEFMVLVGSSGSGKTTALRMIAGLESIDEGDVRLGDRVINGVEPRKRDLAMVFQNYALYPHMTVFENIAFPLQSVRVSKAEIRKRVEETAGILGLSEYLKRKPRALSGGQRQRVAMGRAIVRQPQAFLMDEPLSNLDAKLRMQMRGEVSTLQRDLGVTTVYVTHDQVEAMSMGSRIAVMRHGVLQQQGAPDAVYHRPENLYVATFIGSPGMNLIGGELVTRDGRLCVMFGPGTIPVADRDRAALERHGASELIVGVRPEALAPAPEASSGVRVTVETVEMLGYEKLVGLSIDASPVDGEQIEEAAHRPDTASLHAIERARIHARFDAGTEVEPDDVIGLTVAPDRLYYFDPRTGLAIR